MLGVTLALGKGGWGRIVLTSYHKDLGKLFS